MPTSALNYTGDVTSSTASIAREILAAVEAAGHRIHHVWGKGSSAEHATGRALDFMVYVRNDAGTATSIDSAAGDFIADYVWEHRDRLGLTHVIWKQRIKSTAVSPGVWRSMSDRGSPTDNHMDHPHLFFNGKAYTPLSRVEPVASRDEVRTPTPRPPAPKPPTADVSALQRAVRVAADGIWGPNTDKAIGAVREAAYRGKYPQGVKYLQSHVGTATDGVVGPNTRAAVRRTVVAIQKALRVAADGIWGPNTDRAYNAARARYRR